MRRIQSFVRREGRLTVGQQRALDTYWPVYGIEADGQAIDLTQRFGREAPVVLEIGFGNGDSLLHMAEMYPQWNFLGIEVHRPGVGHLLKHVGERGITNVRVMQQDAVQILKTQIGDGSLDRVLLFFPDPWHKKKHHKRRIVQAEFVQVLRTKLRDGGIFHMATDWQQYAEHMLEVMEAAEGFKNCAGVGRYSDRPEYRVETRFERRCQRLGHGVWDLLFAKTGNE